MGGGVLSFVEAATSICHYTRSYSLVPFQFFNVFEAVRNLGTVRSKNLLKENKSQNKEQYGGGKKQIPHP